ncbi:bifunctional adenosylcobinamide kinase/adenosylcobinamide-phosphate guanylyltransferase [Alkalinema sp. FACHB-956]|uniref:bifunctional adenosylcobinamide kinase/adenosylcobinamide-phosphate guanylyltransferase n=1 Tax=Alkalinema sp. FACHB-956 TaxID=2692768 RepID=UPI001681E964|nr:bifunctional adenosylcobinamide kinase/adenosylcobinamide-phosphate guanylyltransferase [Alkalinema sp. FACHB-956]MBD2328763.1 bifunctional adenosylcobinamide kinase/adenosylcobinamide-phosphate guanylyltransferase [Alkalinema sp. FACHB-956]
MVQILKMIILVTGPARSGKSEWAEQLAQQSGQAVVYLATAQTDPTDQEWQARIIQHQQRRPDDWQTWAEPIALADRLRQLTPGHCCLVDSLGTWLANLLEQDETTWQHTVDDLLQVLQTLPITVIFVSEETGWGVVPAYPIGRLFRDRLGSLTRQIAAIADVTYLVTGGHVLNLSQIGQKLNLDRVT